MVAPSAAAADAGVAVSSLPSRQRQLINSLTRRLRHRLITAATTLEIFHPKGHRLGDFHERYMLEGEIGRGGFGVVYAARRISDRHPVAVKIVEKAGVLKWKRVAADVFIPSEVAHLQTATGVPGVIGLLDWYTSRDDVVLVLERPTDACDLFSLLQKNGALDETAARRVFRQIVDTVCALHDEHGIVHRDIKDENVLLSTASGTVHLIDFGAAKRVHKAAQSRDDFQGTRSYCPPEHFRREKYKPVEATVWQLGVLLYVLCTGQLPFKSELEVCLGYIRFPPTLSKDVCNLIKSCLSTMPSARASLHAIQTHSWLRASDEEDH